MSEAINTSLRSGYTPFIQVRRRDNLFDLKYVSLLWRCPRPESESSVACPIEETDPEPVEEDWYGRPAEGLLIRKLKYNDRSYPEGVTVGEALKILELFDREQDEIYGRS